jgi:hypothetical protein
MAFESTRWTSTKGGATNRAPYGLGAVWALPSETLEARWTELIRNYNSIVKQLSTAERGFILGRYNAFFDFADAKKTPWTEAEKGLWTSLYSGAAEALEKARITQGLPAFPAPPVVSVPKQGATVVLQEEVVAGRGWGFMVVLAAGLALTTIAIARSLDHD